MTSTGSSIGQFEISRDGRDHGSPRDLARTQTVYNKNVMPLIVHAPTLKHYVDLLTKSSFLYVDVEHDAGGGCGDGDLADPRHYAGLSAGEDALCRRVADRDDYCGKLHGVGVGTVQRIKAAMVRVPRYPRS
jgi:hypothetical protein